MLIWIGNIILLPVHKIVLSITRLNKKQQNSILLNIMFCQLLFLTVFKDNTIFNDIWAYLEGFEYSKTIAWNDIYKIRDAFGYLNYELGWRYYVKTLSTLSNNEGILIFVTGFIIIYSYFILIKKYSLIPWLSIFLFITIVFYNSLLVLRQNLAIAIYLYSLPLIVERKLWKFLLVMGLAFLFHKTAILFIPLYFLYPLKLRMKMILTFLIAGFLFNYIFTLLLDIGISYFAKYEIYRISDYTVANATPFLISFMVLLFISTQYYPFKKVREYDKLFFIMIMIVTIFDFSRIGSAAGTIGRLSAYFYPAIIILLPNVIKNVETPILKYMSTGAIVILYFFMMLNQMNYGFDLIIY